MNNLDKYRNRIEAVMPDRSLIHTNIIAGNLLVAVSWPLYNDPKRPNKRSKTIAINITRDAVEDLNEMSERMQEDALDTFEDILIYKMAHFEPDHSTPYGSLNPIEEWVITTDMIQPYSKYGQSQSMPNKVYGLHK